MLAFRLRVLIPLFALPCAAQWTQPQKEWGLATSAILNQVNQGRHDLLSPVELTPAEAETHRQLLSRWWDVHSHKDLLDVLDSLLNTDTDKKSVGWNCPRAVIVARWGYVAGYIDESEAWKYIVPAARRIQRTFSSWQELGEFYLAGRFAWSPNIVDNRDAEYAYRVLVMNADGPWRKLPWNLDLGGEEPVPPSPDKTTEFTLQSHADGLTCVRLRLPDHGREPAVLPVMENVLGCHPQITSDKMDDRDWVLDAECLKPAVVVGAQAITHLRMEPLADWLRTNGFTQLFYYVQHTPVGASELLPAPHDAWIANDLREYVDRRWLRDPFPDLTLTYGLPERSVRVFLSASALFVIAALAVALAMRQQLAQAGPLARIHGWAWLFRLSIWLGWLVLSVSLHGFVIVGFRTGSEGIGADFRALRWYPLAIFTLRLIVELLLTSQVIRRIAPSLSPLRFLWMSFWRVAMELPFALLLLLLSNPRDPVEPLTPAVVVILVALGAVVTLIARHSYRVALDNRGAPAPEGEFHDAVFQMAARLNAPLKRLYIVPDGIGVHFSPSFGTKAGMIGTKAGMMIPERLVRNLSRREMDAFVAHTLLLIRIRYLRRASWLALLLLLIGTVLALAITGVSRDSNENLAALVLVVSVAITTFIAYVQIVRARAEQALTEIPGAPEGWIAAVAHASRLAGAAVPAAVILSLAKRARIAPQQMLALTDLGLPGGTYPLPEFDRNSLVTIT